MSALPPTATAKADIRGFSSALKIEPGTLPGFDRLNRFVSARVVDQEAAPGKLATARLTTVQLVAEVCAGRLLGLTTSG